MHDPKPTERDIVEKLADDFLCSYRAGKCPRIDEFVERNPELADELRDLLTSIIILEENARGPGGATSTAGATTDSTGPPRSIGDFLVIREVGRGGMGVVYEAVQESLHRHVALKVLSSPGLFHPACLERFRREARSAARLQHSNIVPVFEFGAHEGTYYYAMQYVPGQSLAQVIESLRQSRAKADGAVGASILTRSSDPGTANGEQIRFSGTGDCDTCAGAWSDTELSTSAGRRQFYRNVARIGLQAAEALAYAHCEGVLHRDIKPSNLLLDAKGNIWITDFGLARTEGDDTLTRTGDFVGTLRYTAPERFEGRSDRSSDVYSLGVTLYELLTLQPLFASGSRAELMRRIAEATPLAPRRIDPSIPVDLETVVLKAIAKEPNARYQRLEPLAEDLRRFLADRPILARRSNVVERFGRWCRRNPVIATLTATVAALLVTTVVILAVSNAQIRHEAATKVAAFEDRAAAISDRRKALGQVWLYRGLYGVDGEQDKSLSDFDKAIALAPDDPEILWLRGFTLGGWGRWDEALADMTKARPLLGTSKSNSLAGCDWFIAMAYIAKGDRAAYREACHNALKRLPTEPKMEERGTLLWMCTVTPYALDNPSQLADFTAAVLPRHDEAPTSDQLLDVGAALFCAGKLPEAQKHLQRSLRQIAEGSPTVDPMSEMFAHLFLAMTQSRLGLGEQAQASLLQAERLSERIKSACWVDDLQLKVLAGEARALVSHAPAISP